MSVGGASVGVSLGRGVAVAVSVSVGWGDGVSVLIAAIASVGAGSGCVAGWTTPGKRLISPSGMPKARKEAGTSGRKMAN